jgi:hypothetical protein
MNTKAQIEVIEESIEEAAKLCLVRTGKIYFHFLVAESGLLMIHSSFGTWGYLWPRRSRAEGETLENLLRTADKHYLAKKLCSEAKVFDLAKALSDARRAICELRRERVYSKEEARELFEQCDEDVATGSEHDFYEWVSQDPHLYEHAMDAQFGMTFSSEYLELRDQIIPVLKQVLERDVA